MFVTVAGHDRSQLGLQEVVKSEFAFLLESGFHIEKEDATLVRYESEHVLVNIFHGRASYELGVEFQLRKTPGESFNLYRVLEWAKSAGVLESVPSTAFQTSSREGVREMVPQIAALVKAYARPLILGDLAVYQTLREQQSKDAAAYTKEVHLRAARRLAEAAWQEKRYAEVVRVYEGIKGDLTPSERMRVHFAEERM